MAVVHYAVPALDRSTGCAANAIARRIVRPAGVAVAKTAPGATHVVSPHGIPGRVADIDSIHSITGPDIDPRPLCLLCPEGLLLEWPLEWPWVQLRRLA